MSTRSSRDKQKELQERLQATLSALLKDEDNKYCVDCDAKGPRWASWNLGIFLCIRCAGIHRNLGVHISKVKSVNLDTWTSEQIAMMQEMGNSRARAVYEANLPDNFRRPQTDSGLEAFIRAKYETKKYIAKEWIPPQPKIQQVVEEPKKEKKRPRPKAATSVQLNVSGPPSKPSTPVEAETSKATEASSPPQPQPQSASVDLLGLDTPAPHASHSAPDLFGSFMGSSTDAAPLNAPVDLTAVSSSPVSQTDTGSTVANGSNQNDLNLFGESAAKEEDKTKTTKESILALYGSGSSQPMFGVPGGMYMPQQMMGGPQQAPPMQQNGSMMGGMMPPNSMSGMTPAMQMPQKGPMPNMPQEAVEQGDNLMVLDPVAEQLAAVRRGVGPQNSTSSAGPNLAPTGAGMSMAYYGISNANTAARDSNGSAPNPMGVSTPAAVPGMYSQAGGVMGNGSAAGGILATAGQYGGDQGYKEMVPSSGYPQQQMYQMDPMMYSMMAQQAFDWNNVMAIQNGYMQHPAGGMMMGGLQHSLSQPNMMMPGNNMYNPAAASPMYNMQMQQQQPLQQMQNQMAGMNLGAGGYQQPAGPVAAAGWGAQPSGQTLSNNLWQ